MKRTELYRGQMLGGIKAIGIDPAGDYILIVHSTAPTKLSKFTVNGAISTVYQSSTVSHLAAASNSRSALFPRRHASEGLVWTFEAIDNGSKWTLFYDYDENGTIDSWSTLNVAQYDATYSMNPLNPDWLTSHVFDHD